MRELQDNETVKEPEELEKELKVCKDALNRFKKLFEYLDERSLTEWTSTCLKTLRLEGNPGGECEIEALWLHVIEEASELAEALRYASIEGIKQNIIGIFAWFGAFLQRIKDHRFGPFTFKEILVRRLIDISNAVIKEMKGARSSRSAKLGNENLERIKEEIKSQVEEKYADLIILSKYPRCCPFCECEKHCNCLGMSEKDYKERKEELEKVEVRARIMKEHGAIKISNNEPKFEVPEKGVRGWKDIFKNIYYRQIRSQTLEQVGFHLMEEIGEVARALRKAKEARGEEEICKEVANLQDELADTFDWIMAILLKIEVLLKEDFMISVLFLDHPTYREDFLSLLPKSPEERQKQEV